MQAIAGNDTGRMGMIVKRVSVPIGLEELMEGLTKEVLLKKPKDLYIFASEYFSRLVILRERSSNYKAYPVRTVQSVTHLKPQNISKESKIASPRPARHLLRQVSTQNKSPVLPTNNQSKPKINVSRKVDRVSRSDKNVANEVLKLPSRRDRSLSMNRKDTTPRSTSSVQSTPREKRQRSNSRDTKSSSNDHKNAEQNKPLKAERKLKNEGKSTTRASTVSGSIAKITDNVAKEKRSITVDMGNDESQFKQADENNEKLNVLINESIKHSPAIVEDLLDSDIWAATTNVQEVSKIIVENNGNKTCATQETEILQDKAIGGNQPIEIIQANSSRLMDKVDEKSNEKSDSTKIITTVTEAADVKKYISNIDEEHLNNKNIIIEEIKEEVRQLPIENDHSVDVGDSSVYVLNYKNQDIPITNKGNTDLKDNLDSAIKDTKNEEIDDKVKKSKLEDHMDDMEPIDSNVQILNVVKLDHNSTVRENNDNGNLKQIQDFKLDKEPINTENNILNTNSKMDKSTMEEIKNVTHVDDSVNNSEIALMEKIVVNVDPKTAKDDLSGKKSRSIEGIALKSDVGPDKSDNNDANATELLEQIINENNPEIIDDPNKMGESKNIENIVNIKMEEMSDSDDVLIVSISENPSPSEDFINNEIESTENLGTKIKPEANVEVIQKTQFFRENKELDSKESETIISNLTSTSTVNKKDNPEEIIVNIEKEKYNNTLKSLETDNNEPKEIDQVNIDDKTKPTSKSPKEHSDVTERIIGLNKSQGQTGRIDSSITKFLTSFISSEQQHLFKANEPIKSDTDLSKTQLSSEERIDGVTNINMTDSTVSDLEQAKHQSLSPKEISKDKEVITTGDIKPNSTVQLTESLENVASKDLTLIDKLETKNILQDSSQLLKVTDVNLTIKNNENKLQKENSLIFNSVKDLLDSEPRKTLVEHFNNEAVSTGKEDSNEESNNSLKLIIVEPDPSDNNISNILSEETDKTSDIGFRNKRSVTGDEIEEIVSYAESKNSNEKSGEHSFSLDEQTAVKSDSSLFSPECSNNSIERDNNQGSTDLPSSKIIIGISKSDNNNIPDGTNNQNIAQVFSKETNTSLDPNLHLKELISDKETLTPQKINENMQLDKQAEGQKIDRKSDFENKIEESEAELDGFKSKTLDDEDMLIGNHSYEKKDFTREIENIKDIEKTQNPILSSDSLSNEKQNTDMKDDKSQDKKIEKLNNDILNSSKEESIEVHSSKKDSSLQQTEQGPKSIDSVSNEKQNTDMKDDKSQDKKIEKLNNDILNSSKEESIEVHSSKKDSSLQQTEQGPKSIDSVSNEKQNTDMKDDKSQNKKIEKLNINDISNSSKEESIEVHSSKKNSSLQQTEQGPKSIDSVSNEKQNTDMKDDKSQDKKIEKLNNDILNSSKEESIEVHSSKKDSSLQQTEQGPKSIDSVSNEKQNTDMKDDKSQDKKIEKLNINDILNSSKEESIEVHSSKKDSSLQQTEQGPKSIDSVSNEKQNTDMKDDKSQDKKIEKLNNDILNSSKEESIEVHSSKKDSSLQQTEQGPKSIDSLSNEKQNTDMKDDKSQDKKIEKLNNDILNSSKEESIEVHSSKKNSSLQQTEQEPKSLDMGTSNLESMDKTAISKENTFIRDDAKERLEVKKIPKIGDIDQVATVIEVIKHIYDDTPSIEQPGFTTVREYLNTFLQNEQEYVFQNEKACKTNLKSSIGDDVDTNQITSREKANESIEKSVDNKKKKPKMTFRSMQERSLSQANILNEKKSSISNTSSNKKIQRARSVGVIKTGDIELKSKIPTPARRSAGRRPLVRQLEADSKELEEKLNFKRSSTKSSKEEKKINSSENETSNEGENNGTYNKNIQENNLVNKEISNFYKSEVAKDDVLIAKTILKGIEGAEKHIELIEEHLKEGTENQTVNIDGVANTLKLNNNNGDSTNSSNKKIVKNVDEIFVDANKNNIKSTEEEPNKVKSMSTENNIYNVNNTSLKLGSEEKKSTFSQPKEGIYEPQIDILSSIQDNKSEKLTDAATTIQKSWKGFQVRKNLEDNKSDKSNQINQSKDMEKRLENIKNEVADDNESKDLQSILTKTETENKVTGEPINTNKSKENEEIGTIVNKNANTFSTKDNQSENHNTFIETNKSKPSIEINQSKDIEKFVDTDSINSEKLNEENQSQANEYVNTNGNKDNEKRIETNESKEKEQQLLKNEFEKENAAVKIQTAWKRFIVRKMMENSNGQDIQATNGQDKAVIKIQAVVRGFLERLKYDKLKAKYSKEQNNTENILIKDDNAKQHEDNIKKIATRGNESKLSSDNADKAVGHENNFSVMASKEEFVREQGNAKHIDATKSGTINSDTDMPRTKLLIDTNYDNNKSNRIRLKMDNQGSTGTANEQNNQSIFGTSIDQHEGKAIENKTTNEFIALGPETSMNIKQLEESDNKPDGGHGSCGDGIANNKVQTDIPKSDTDVIHKKDNIDFQTLPIQKDTNYLNIGSADKVTDVNKALEVDKNVLEANADKDYAKEKDSNTADLDIDNTNILKASDSKGKEIDTITDNANIALSFQNNSKNHVNINDANIKSNKINAELSPLAINSESGKEVPNTTECIVTNAIKDANTDHQFTHKLQKDDTLNPESQSKIESVKTNSINNDKVVNKNDVGLQKIADEDNILKEEQDEKINKIQSNEITNNILDDNTNKYEDSSNKDGASDLKKYDNASGQSDDKINNINTNVHTEHESLNKGEITNIDQVGKSFSDKPDFYRSNTVIEPTLVKKSISHLGEDTNDSQGLTQTQSTLKTEKDSNNNTSKQETELEKDVRAAVQEIVSKNNKVDKNLTPLEVDISQAVKDIMENNIHVDSKTVDTFSSKKESSVPVAKDVNLSKMISLDTALKNLPEVPTDEVPKSIRQNAISTLKLQKNDTIQELNEPEKKLNTSQKVVRTESKQLAESGESSIKKDIGIGHKIESVNVAPKEGVGEPNFSKSISTERALEYNNENLENNDDAASLEIPADDQSSVGSVDSIVTVILKPKHDTHGTQDSLPSNKKQDSKDKMQFQDKKWDQTETIVSSKKMPSKALSTSALEDHVELIDQVQNSLLDQLSGKTMDSKNKFDIEQLRKELHEAATLYNSEDDNSVIGHDAEVMNYLYDFEPEDDNAYDSRMVRTPLRELPDIAEESENKEEDADSGRKTDIPDKETKHDQSVFCGTPNTSIYKVIDGKPLHNHVEVVNSVHPNERCNEIIINNDNIEINKASDASDKQHQKLLHTSELHDPVIIPASGNTLQSLHSNSSKESNSAGLSAPISLKHTSEFHDTVVVPLPSGVDVKITNASKELLPENNMETSHASSMDSGNQTSIQQAPAGVEVVTSRRRLQDGVDVAQAQASLKDTSPAKPESGGSFTHQSPPQSPRSAKQAMESENNNNKRNNAISNNVPVAEKNMENQAAAKIQAGFRGYQVRKQLKAKNAAVDQKRQLRKRSSRENMKDPALEEKSAVKIQAGVRGFLVRRRQKKQINSSASA